MSEKQKVYFVDYLSDRSSFFDFSLGPFSSWKVADFKRQSGSQEVQENSGTESAEAEILPDGRILARNKVYPKFED